MSSKHKCGACKSYEERGHNYCRMCGSNFKVGKVKNARKAIAYNTNEKFCGYCGGEKRSCSC